MDHKYYIILGVGLLAQVFFSARVIIQWILSERARQVLSPSLFWVFSLAGAFLLCLYGWLREDFAIVLGQFVSYYIYLANLNMKGIWRKLPFYIQTVLTITPIAAICFVASHANEFISHFLHNEQVPLWLLIFGSAGQLLFTLRFVYQWLYSINKGESKLPEVFWIISLLGSLTIVSYGILRSDIVLILGQSFGIIAYVRNLCLLKKTN